MSAVRRMGGLLARHNPGPEGRNLFQTRQNTFRITGERESWIPFLEAAFPDFDPELPKFDPAFREIDPVFLKFDPERHYFEPQFPKYEPFCTNRERQLTNRAPQCTTTALNAVREIEFWQIPMGIFRDFWLCLI